MDQQRIDKPGVDQNEQYVYYSSPGVLTTQAVKTYHADVAYGWGAAQPLVLDFTISINLDSVPLDDARYPEGHFCDQCLLPMPANTVAINVPTINGLGETLVCISCARDAEWSRTYSQPWEIDLALVRSVLQCNDERSFGEGNVKVSRADGETVTLKLTGVSADGEHQEYCFLNLPIDRLWAFVQEIDRFMGASDLAAVESAFLDSGLDMLESWANGEI